MLPQSSFVSKCEHITQRKLQFLTYDLQSSCAVFVHFYIFKLGSTSAPLGRTKCQALIISLWFHQFDNQFSEFQYLPLTRSQSDGASLGCGGIGNSQQECAAPAWYCQEFLFFFLTMILQLQFPLWISFNGMLKLNAVWYACFHCTTEFFSLSSLDEDGMSSVTMWIVGDLEKASGRKLLLNALKHVVGFSTSFPHSILPWLNLCSRGQYFTSLKFFQGMNADSINAIFHIGLSLTQILHLVSLQLQNLSAVNPWSTFRQEEMNNIKMV